MAEDQDDASKTEQPTGKRLGDAAGKGDLPISNEVKILINLVATVAVLAFIVPGLTATLANDMRLMVERAAIAPADDGHGAGIALLTVAFTALRAVAVPVLIFAVSGVAGGIFQTGFNVRWDAIGLKFDRLNPGEWLGRLFGGRGKAAVEFVKNMLKIAIVGVVIWLVLKPMFIGAEHFAGLGLDKVVEEATRLARQLLIAVTLIMALIAAGDYMYQKYAYTKRMKMTKQEVKDEQKNTDGDPLVKGKLRQIRFQRARRRVIAMVPKADVVVTNPTHFAVAMQYDPKTMAAPRVVAKGVDLIAIRIRQVADDHDIPIVENPPLARALYATVDENKEIPPEHYRAVAEIISYVFKLKNRSVTG